MSLSLASVEAVFAMGCVCGVVVRECVGVVTVRAGLDGEISSIIFSRKSLESSDPIGCSLYASIFRRNDLHVVAKREGASLLWGVQVGRQASAQRTFPDMGGMSVEI